MPAGSVARTHAQDCRRDVGPPPAAGRRFVAAAGHWVSPQGELAKNWGGWAARPSPDACLDALTLRCPTCLRCADADVAFFPALPPADTKNPELFAALTLLVVLGTSLVTQVAGLSLALGAFLVSAKPCPTPDPCRCPGAGPAPARPGGPFLVSEAAPPAGRCPRPCRPEAHAPPRAAPCSAVPRHELPRPAATRLP